MRGTSAFGQFRTVLHLMHHSAICECFLLLIHSSHLALAGKRSGRAADDTTHAICKHAASAPVPAAHPRRSGIEGRAAAELSAPEPCLEAQLLLGLRRHSAQNRRLREIAQTGEQRRAEGSARAKSRVARRQVRVEGRRVREVREGAHGVHEQGSLQQQRRPDVLRWVVPAPRDPF